MHVRYEFYHHDMILDTMTRFFTGDFVILPSIPRCLLLALPLDTCANRERESGDGGDRWKM